MNTKQSMLRKSLRWVNALALSVFMVVAASANAQDGAKLFKQNCAACHKLDKKAIGPALAGVEDRWESKENLIAWIKDSQGYLKANPSDAYASDLFESFNKSIMPPQALADDQINAILGYIANPPVVVGDPAPKGPSPDAAPGKDYTTYWLLAFMVVFLIVLKVLMDVKKSVKQVLLDVKGEEYMNEKLGEPNDLEWTAKQKRQYWMAKNRGLVVTICIAAMLSVTYGAWDSLMGIGVYNGYAPEQPIKFSHKIHAGDNAINCVYCHSSAEKGKVSGIPSANVCMNCHKGISEGSLYGTEEIQKIYDAVGWDPDEMAYTKPEQPIKWIRIHNLPDHVYFNHSQHVVVGKVECQTCHGEVETFEYPMKQFAPLTMGWCINCHRETEVKMNGNAYYDELHKELVEKYKDQGLEKFTVSQIGGLECAKCHY